MPINIATGQVYLDREDITIAGALPMTWARHYKAGMETLHSPLLGPNWTNRYLCSLRRDPDGFRFITSLGSEEFIADAAGGVEGGRRAVSKGSYLEIYSDGSRYIVQSWNPESFEVVRYCFRIGRSGDTTRLDSIEDATGLAIDLQWDAAGRLQRVRQRIEGRSLRLEYGADNQIRALRLEAQDGSIHPICRYEYDATGQLSAVLNAADIPDQYFYDAPGQLVREVARDGGVFHFKYDAAGRCVRFSGLDHYNEKTLRFLEATGHTEVTNSYGDTARYRYLPSGQITDTWDELGNHSSTDYDAFGRIASLTSGLGAETAYQYDEMGNRSAIINALGHRTSFTFNEHHQPVRIVNAADGAWKRIYDQLNRLVATEDPLGSRWKLEYDPLSLLTSVTDPKGSARRVRYRAGVPNEASDWAGNITKLQFDAFGRLTHTIDPKGAQTLTQYDPVGNPIKAVLPDGRILAATYDAGGNLTARFNSAGVEMRFLYGPCGRLLKRTDGNGHSLSYIWGSEPGWLESITNQKGEVFRLERDAAGRTVREISFDDRVQGFDYDADGRCVKITKAGGDTLSFVRNLLGSVEQQIGADGTKSTFSYDLNGRLIEAVNESGAISLQRDSLGQIVRQRFNENWIVSSYDPLGNVVRTSSDLGPTTVYEFDENSLWKSLDVDGHDLILFDRDSVGNELERKLPGNARLTQEFDPVGRLTSQRLMSGGTENNARRNDKAMATPQSIDRAYVYDAAARVIEIADRFWGSSHFGYDSAGRLLQAVGPLGRQEHFEYDDAGNILKHQLDHDTQNSVSMHYEVGNRLGRAGNADCSYDSDGRLVSKTEHKGKEPSRISRYFWNSLDQLVKFESPDNDIWLYSYDALGRRIQKRGPAISTRFFWDGARMVYEKPSDGSSANSWKYEQFGFAPLLTIQNGKAFSIVCDHIGTPREAVDGRGKVVARFRQTSYGKRLPQESPGVHMPMRLPGQFSDDESGLHYNFYRYYDPSCARYVQQDPVRQSFGENFYSYCRNPLANIDPFGLAESCAIPRVIVTPDGVAIPSQAAELKKVLGNLQETSTNPDSSRKFVGADSLGPIRIRVEKAHPADPGFTGTPDPLHTVDHLHIDRRENGATGPWYSKEKVPYEWPF